MKVRTYTRTPVCSDEEEQLGKLRSPTMSASHASRPLSQQQLRQTVNVDEDSRRILPSQLLGLHLPRPSLPTDAKHGKARMHEDDPSIAQVQQYTQMRSRRGAGSSEAPRPGSDGYDGPRSSKRRRLSVERHEDTWEGAEDVEMLNKVGGSARDCSLLERLN